MSLYELAQLICPECRGMCCKGNGEFRVFEFIVKSTHAPKDVLSFCDRAVYTLVHDGTPCKLSDKGCSEQEKPWVCRHNYCNLIDSIFIGDVDNIYTNDTWILPSLRSVYISIMEGV